MWRKFRFYLDFKAVGWVGMALLPLLQGATPKGGKTGARKNGSAEADPKAIPDL